MAGKVRATIKAVLVEDRFNAWYARQPKINFTCGSSANCPIAVYLQRRLRRVVWVFYDRVRNQTRLWIMVRERSGESYYQPPEWVCAFVKRFDNWNP